MQDPGASGYLVVLSSSIRSEPDIRYFPLMASPRISSEGEPSQNSLTGDDPGILWFGPTRAAIETRQPELMVYFTPENPCLMSYYTSFLAHLSTLLNPDSEHHRRTIGCGSTLPGFQSSNPVTIKGTLPASLTDQILKFRGADRSSNH